MVKSVEKEKRKSSVKAYYITYGTAIYGCQWNQITMFIDVTADRSNRMNWSIQVYIHCSDSVKCCKTHLIVQMDNDPEYNAKATNPRVFCGKEMGWSSKVKSAIWCQPTEQLFSFCWRQKWVQKDPQTSSSWRCSKGLAKHLKGEHNASRLQSLTPNNFLHGI